jgi:hypothetical protein
MKRSHRSVVLLTCTLALLASALVLAGCSSPTTSSSGKPNEK